MNITVLGLWHLGSVTAACCAGHHRVTGLDFDPATVATLNGGKAPLFEPGLDALLTSGLVARTLSFTTDPAVACAGADMLWVCYDTPVNDDDESDVAFVLANLGRALPHLADGTLVLVSSQLPVGTCATLEGAFPRLRFASCPENLRLGGAIESFCKADRFVVGLRDEADRARLETLFAPFNVPVIFMRTESAEMVKHALNSFLALSVAYVNEIARLCEHVGADAAEVSAGVKSDSRVGPKAYLRAGGPFAGGTLARDVVTLTSVAASVQENVSIVPAIKRSNDEHRRWPLSVLQARLGGLRGRVVGVLGLTYKPGTDTLRRSAAVELCAELLARGCTVRAFDPAVRSLPVELAEVALCSSIGEALASADAAVICTEWPEIRDAAWPDVVQVMRGRIIVDANRFLERGIKDVAGVQYLSVGRA